MTDYEKTLQMIEEYENSGGDIANFKSHIGALAAGNATPFLGLNHWKSSDKPVMDDFNRDNEKIDAAVRELWEKKADMIGATDLHRISQDCIAVWGKATLNTPYTAGLTTGDNGLCIIRYSNENALSLLCTVSGRTEIFTQRKSSGSWYDWVRLVTAEPPRIFDLPLMTGWSLAPSGPSAEYFKTQEGLVVVSFKVVFPAGLPVGQHDFATLPAGYRPARLVHNVISTAYFNGNTLEAWVNTNGRIRIQVHTAIPADVNAGIGGEIVFLATQ